ncbi:hypothetical protein HMPREF3034_00585 [Prevotella sp. DNF00663]|uniref:GNAT family N-acetyltransferase n=1 Tax=Prevotella sp. DNF00663 TaxID=1384078 RepID=UPI000783E722|nr:GNAT family N-acetyltransferase [Prevotella sp. DNF00663]KXB84849.1 hypothetical protein HMPREF3034_00585 [Prevotella sp. DNF00663]
MVGVTVRIISKSIDLPDIEYRNFFHSKEFFNIVKHSPEQTPYMAVAERDGECIAHLLATVRRRGSLLPPYLYSQGRVFGEGEYKDESEKVELFELLLKAITKKLRRRLCLYIEFSDISQKMFGYKTFRQNHYFPVSWQEIHNSLHSKTPEERLTAKQLKRINKIYQAGLETREVGNLKELSKLYQIFKRYYRTRLHRFLPSEHHFQQLYQSTNVKCFVTTYKDNIIGGAVCVYSDGNAYLWHFASKKKRHPRLHPNFMTVWNTLKYAYTHNYAHLFFMDAGLPFKRNLVREFTLSFGGKPVAKYRWFRCTIPWINSFLAWIYKE